MLRNFDKIETLHGDMYVVNITMQNVMQYIPNWCKPNTVKQNTVVHVIPPEYKCSACTKAIPAQNAYIICGICDSRIHIQCFDIEQGDRKYCKCTQCNFIGTQCYSKSDWV
jgi:Zn finger protein HypA/HybF involved in hydrogenase expression